MNDGFDSTLGAAASRRRVCFIRVGTRRRDAGAPGRSGFTLIEMMVVLVLIGILSAMILPEMKGTYGDALLRSSARDLVNVFSIASSRAVSLNQLHVVRINATTGRYEIERQSQAQGKKAEFAPLKDVSDSSGELDNRITVEIRKSDALESDKPEGEQAPLSTDQTENQVPPGAVAFYPDGTAEAAEVLLHDREGFGLRLKISPITARIQILEQAREHQAEDH
jgi:type II secretion system protein H